MKYNLYSLDQECVPVDKITVKQNYVQNKEKLSKNLLLLGGEAISLEGENFPIL